MNENTNNTGSLGIIGNESSERGIRNFTNDESSTNFSTDNRESRERRWRNDINSRSLDINEMSNDVVMDEKRMIWGTNIVVTTVLLKFRDFLNNFTPNHLMDRVKNNPSEIEPFFPKFIKQIVDLQLCFINLDCQYLIAYPNTKDLYQQLIMYPQEIIPLMDIVVNEMARKYKSCQLNLQVRPYNIGRVDNMRDLDPKNVDQIVCIKGLVIRTSDIVPDMRAAYFRCNSCGSSEIIENIKGKVLEPERCQNNNCGSLKTMEIQHNRSIYSDKQLLKIQETPDKIPDGQTPHSITCCVYDSLKDVSRAGDRIEITGIYKISPIRVNHRQRKIKNIFRSYIDIIHIKKIQKGKLRLGNDEVTSEELQTMELSELTSESEYMTEEIIKLSQDPNLFEKLIKSFCPSIYGLEIVKKSILLQLFGGVPKTIGKTGKTNIRGDIHILLTGDPSMSKSQFLNYAYKIAPRGIYTSGKGSSSVGLTAFITRDAETKHITLESGAFVLADGGICCIDEFDKMSVDTRAVLHEVMEQQTVSIAKAGIIATLNARSSVLAAANPIDSKYNQKKTLIENINLPPSILSRFDIICLVIDNPDPILDSKLARHIGEIYSFQNLQEKKPPISPELFARYISYARTKINPELSDEAIDELLKGYISMRRVNNSSESGINVVSATVRQLEAMIRLSEAHARMRLSKVVEKNDAIEAISIIKNAILTYALDPKTGKIDMGMINTGKSESKRQLIRQAQIEIIKILENSVTRSLKASEIQKKLFKVLNNLDDSVFKDSIIDLVSEEKVTVDIPFISSSFVKLIEI